MHGSIQNNEFQILNRFYPLCPNDLVISSPEVGTCKRSRVEGDKGIEGAGVRSGSCRVGSFARDGLGVVGPTRARHPQGDLIGGAFAVPSEAG